MLMMMCATVLPPPSASLHCDVSHTFFSFNFLLANRADDVCV